MKSIIRLLSLKIGAMKLYRHLHAIFLLKELAKKDSRIETEDDPGTTMEGFVTVIHSADFNRSPEALALQYFVEMIPQSDFTVVFPKDTPQEVKNQELANAEEKWSHAVAENLHWFLTSSSGKQPRATAQASITDALENAAMLFMVSEDEEVPMRPVKGEKVGFEWSKYTITNLLTKCLIANDLEVYERALKLIMQHLNDEVKNDIILERDFSKQILDSRLF